MAETEFQEAQIDGRPAADAEEIQLAWFIIHTYSGYEGKVRESLRQRVVLEGRGDYFGEIEIPEETYEEMKTDVKTGKKERVLRKRKSFPGYLLIQIAVTKKGSGFEISDGLAPGPQHPQGHQLRERQQEEALAPDGRRGAADNEPHGGDAGAPQAEIQF